jgi:hypothetical protein
MMETTANPGRTGRSRAGAPARSDPARIPAARPTGARAMQPPSPGRTAMASDRRTPPNSGVFCLPV